MPIAPTPVPGFEEAMPPVQLFLGLRGRVSRRVFWLYGVLAPLALALVAIALLTIAGLPRDRAETTANVLLTWPAVAVAVKRWHDRDRSGWWVLVVLIPVIGWLWALLDNGFVRGTRGPNRFGADPLG
jgi:uncharacterized membrane protein YhaH (DUF805 family)